MKYKLEIRGFLGAAILYKSMKLGTPDYVSSFIIIVLFGIRIACRSRARRGRSTLLEASRKRFSEMIPVQTGTRAKGSRLAHALLFLRLRSTTIVTRYIMAHSMAVATMYFNKLFTSCMPYLSLFVKLTLVSSFRSYPPLRVSTDRPRSGAPGRPRVKANVAPRRDPSIASVVVRPVN